MNPDRLLTSRRLRAHGLLFAVTIWSFYIWMLATPTLRDRYGNLKGTDFLHLYTLGSLAISHRGADLYNVNAQALLAAQRVPDSAGIRYLPLYPPQVSVLFAPLAHLSYGWALIAWWAGTALIYAGCIYGAWKTCSHLQDAPWSVALLSFAYPAFFHLIAWGQTSALALVCLTGAFLLLRKRRFFGAGLVLGCLIFKPQLGLGIAIIFVATRAWGVVSGAILTASVQLGCGILYYGWDPFRAWIRALAHVPSSLPAFEPRLYQTHCLRTFWSMLIPADGLAFSLYVLSAGVILTWTISIWRSRAPLSVRYALALFATVLVSPHLNVYDLVILAPGILLLVDWLIAQPSAPTVMGTLLYLVYALPLVGPFTRWTHLQLSVVAMSALVYLTWRMPRRVPSSYRNSNELGTANS